MLHFPILSTVRMRMQMRELTIGESIAIAGFPDGGEEAANTLMLRSCAKESNIDPMYLTLQERTLAVAQYLMAINTEQPDFPIGSTARFSQYLQANCEIDPSTVDRPLYVGELEGDHWAVNHLYGYMLEAIERVQGLVTMPGVAHGQRVPMTPRQHWTFGCMAAQMARVAMSETGEVGAVLDAVPAPESMGQYDDWLIKQMTIFSAMPDNAFAALYMLYRCGKTALHHLFDWEFSVEGRPVFMPAPDAQKEAEAALPPATFHAGSCLSPAARELGGKHGPTGA